MSVSDAVTARGMSQRIERAIPAIQQNWLEQNALLALAKARGKIKYQGSHTEFEWYIRRTTGNAAEWGGGELGIRTFEEINPVDRAHLPYCWLEKTYGVSDRSIETNRHAGGRQKVYDVLKENLVIAQQLAYSALVPTIYSGGSDGNGDASGEPTGLMWAFGNAYQSTHDVAISAGASYANQTLNTSAIAAYSASKAGFDSVHWAPIAINLQEIPGTTDGSSAWSTDALIALSFMADEMAVTQDVSGTGKPIKPDIALMRPTEFNAVKNLLLASQILGGVPLGDVSPVMAKFKNVVVDTLTVIRDTNVPLDSTHASGAGIPRVIVMDSSEFYIKTTHTKAEGLIKNEFDTNNPLVSGAIGVLKANLGYCLSSPAAIGVIVGAD